MNRSTEVLPAYACAIININILIGETFVSERQNSTFSIFFIYSLATVFVLVTKVIFSDALFFLK